VAETETGCPSSEGDAASEANTLGREAHKLIAAREYDAAGMLIERAIALAPDNAILAHTKAHLAIDSGAFAAGAAYLRSFLATHDPFQGVNVHTAWHLAYIELQLGRPAASLDWHRRVVVPTLIPMTFYSAVSLLWQHEVHGSGGLALRSDWLEMRRAAQSVAGTSCLDDLARAMIFIACGDEPGLADLVEDLGARAADPVATEVVLPVVEGLRAYWRGDFAGATDRLEAIVPSLGRLSEFPDQLGVVYETLGAARAKAPAAAGSA
jgi:hypothetical protein